MATTEKRAAVVRRSRAERQALVARWRKSGVSIAEFSRREGVAAHVVRYGLAQERLSRAPKTAASDFVVMSVPEREPPHRVKAPSKSEAAGSHLQSAVIVVVASATPMQLAETVRAFIQESGA